MRGLIHPGVAFLDRDGTLNKKAPEGDYIKRPEEVAVLPGTAEAVRRLNEAGVGVIVVTNQRGIALGRMSESDLEEVHAEVSAQLWAANGARIDAFFHCPHDIGECDCRKPGTGMFRQAVKRFPWIEVSQSVMIGDGDRDVEAGMAMGMRTVQLGVDAPDLNAALDHLLEGSSASARNSGKFRG